MPQIDKINALDSRLGQYGKLFQHYGRLIVAKRDDRLGKEEAVEMHLLALVMALPIGSGTSLSFAQATASVELLAESLDPSGLDGVANYYPLLVSAWRHVCELVSDPR
jgi:hypothetical protein